ncbi:MAG: hypothetical protein A2358_03965 [Candidatus Staskawiczbacteria bacterium RIFOXYB1_FULL_37_44]|uniref:Uncharacterized protein n=1 Tax=Candidatus Staskawiczbacteria bacterium RIFOXYB1_FULL_37_44 TaxID=1802223 RepID=A0A1G2IXN6_9BACT|nr:MAG: hypothetical protein A2358_03965 [Candidatus Staskawiczbacteria bacterium RIFOXYB1_FULL_37_44]OGZ89579.1 MAG: hypothetical protein A2444_01435 [Candidatus Staskawiczbacteria bacterium RIFOXYC2_FULL_37_19]
MHQSASFLRIKNMDIEPPKELFGKILKRIHREERLLVFRKVVIFSVMITGSLVGFVPSLKMLLADFRQSGFINFFSLIFSDFTVVRTYWQSFAMILLETLPALSLVLFLGVLLILLQSIKSLTKNYYEYKQYFRIKII